MSSTWLPTLFACPTRRLVPRPGPRPHPPAVAMRTGLPDRPDRSGHTLATAVKRFDIQRDGKTLVLTTQRDLRELDLDAIEEHELLRLAGSRAVRNVVVDLGGTETFCPAAVGLFLRLWQAVGARD